MKQYMKQCRKCGTLLYDEELEYSVCGLCAGEQKEDESDQWRETEQDEQEQLITNYENYYEAIYENYQN